jgi:hypothetical protein
VVELRAQTHLLQEELAQAKKEGNGLRGSLLALLEYFASQGQLQSLPADLQQLFDSFRSDPLKNQFSDGCFRIVEVVREVEVERSVEVELFLGRFPSISNAWSKCPSRG